MKWYTIFCKSRKETQVADYLRSNGIRVYHPTLRAKPVNPRSSQVKSYFPRYVFVAVDIMEVGVSILQNVPGAVGLVEFGGEPAMIPETFITELRQRIAQIEAAGGLHLDGVEPGDEIMIRSGPFAGYDAIFDLRLSDESRVQVLLQWMGREIKAKVDSNAVEKRRRQR